MSRHTPGPWSINDWPQANSDIAVGAVGTPLVARVPIRDVSIVGQMANARLIAAAPDLLDTLQHIESAAMDLTCERRTIRDAARAAIAKATGGET